MLILYLKYIIIFLKFINIRLIGWGEIKKGHALDKKKWVNSIKIMYHRFLIFIKFLILLIIIFSVFLFFFYIIFTIKLLINI